MRREEKYMSSRTWMLENKREVPAGEAGVLQVLLLVRIQHGLQHAEVVSDFGKKKFGE